MGLKILLQESVHEDEMGADSKIIWDGVRRLVGKLVGPETELIIRYVEKDSSTPDSLKNWPWPQAWPCLQPIRQPASSF